MDHTEQTADRIRNLEQGGLIPFTAKDAGTDEPICTPDISALING